MAKPAKPRAKGAKLAKPAKPSRQPGRVRPCNGPVVDQLGCDGDEARQETCGKHGDEAASLAVSLQHIELGPS